MARAELDAIISLREEISGKVAQVDRKLAQLDTKLKNVNRSGTGLSTTFRSGALQAVGLGTAVGAAALGVSKLVSVVGDGVRGFASFEASMTKIETLVGVSREEVEGFSQSVRDLAGETGRAPGELADAMFQITSAGLRGRDAMIALEASAKGAAIGLGDTAVVADAATSIVNAYGTETINASEAVDVLIATVQEGKAGADEFASAIGSVVPIASSAGVSIQEVGAMMAILTRSGASASEAATQVAGIIRAVVKPSSQATKELGKLGLSMDNVRESVRDRGLNATMQELTQLLDEEGIARFAGRAEALNGILGTTGDKFETTQSALETTINSLGRGEEAFERVGETAAQKAAVVSAAWQNTKQELGEIFNDIAFGVLSAFQPPDVSEFEALGAIVRGVFARGDIAVEGRALALELGIIDQHGRQTADAMEKLRAKLDELGVEGATADEIIARLPQTLDKAAESFEPLGDKAAETADSIVENFLKTGKIVAPIDEASEATARTLKEMQEADDARAKAAAEASKKAEEARKREQEAAQRLADSLGVQGLLGEQEKLNAAIAIAIEQGGLTAEGNERVIETYFRLKEEGIQLEGVFAALDERIRAVGASLQAFPFPPVDTLEQDIGELDGAFANLEEQIIETSGTMPPLGEAGERATEQAFKGTRTWDEATKDVADTLSEVRGVMNLVGVDADSTAGKIIEGFSKVFDTLNAVLGIISRISGGLGGIGSGISGLTGGGGGGGLGGLLGGLGGLIPGGGIGALAIGGAVAGIGALAGAFGGGRDSGTVQEEALRDMGQQISEGLAQAIFESDINPQAFVAEIFSESGGTVDRLAEEIGDIFSAVEQGNLTNAQAQDALSNAIPLLIEGFDGLTAEGEGQVERIISAAEAFGLDVSALTQFLSEQGEANAAQAAAAAAASGGGSAGANAEQEASRLPQAPPPPSAPRTEAGAPGEGAGGGDTNITINVTHEAGVIAIDPNELAQASADAVGIIMRDQLGDAIPNIKVNLQGTFAPAE